MAQQLDEAEWGKIYNFGSEAQSLVNALTSNEYSCWTNELLRIIPNGSRTLEIGSGSGQSSLALAQKGCDVTLLDFGLEQLTRAEYAAQQLAINIATVQHDAVNPLPFDRQAPPFNYIFHAGLLEHFEPDERIDLLKLWKPHCETMISMIPNSASIAYALGKEYQEHNGTWKWGRELPAHTQIREFMLSGYEVTDEYTIGASTALSFLYNNDPIKHALCELWENRHASGIYNNFHQGYLLVTIGQNPDYKKSHH